MQSADEELREYMRRPEIRQVLREYFQEENKRNPCPPPIPKDPVLALGFLNRLIYEKVKKKLDILGDFWSDL